jgi:hypothetical protein
VQDAWQDTRHPVGQEPTGLFMVSCVPGRDFCWLWSTVLLQKPIVAQRVKNCRPSTEPEVLLLCPEEPTTDRTWARWIQFTSYSLMFSSIYTAPEDADSIQQKRCTIRLKCAPVWSTHTTHTRFFAYVIGVDVHLLLIQAQCFDLSFPWI